ncbi:MAG: NFYB/HAP3 family transcription factor subunit [Candidatus Aenigmarchaeota archaeon]|nr:NFYB/HAP3 family transcription factor subunit [Candidatus Aenigmarchaeota archaeon]
MVKEFPLLPLEKIAKKAGKEVGADRVALSATKELRNALLEIADKIAIDAVVAAHHAKRVTVKREDIVLATRK